MSEKYASACDDSDCECRRDPSWPDNLPCRAGISVRKKAPPEQCCDECGRDTRFGTGLFVNRLAADIGYICPDCSAIDCDRCEEKIALDEDIRPWQLGLEEENEFGDGAFFVHEECLTPEEATLLAEQQEKEDD